MTLLESMKSAGFTIRFWILLRFILAEQFERDLRMELMNKDEIRKGIAAYEKRQQVLMRLIRKTGGLTETKFDELFLGREWRKIVRFSAAPITGDSFILGAGINGFNMWAENLELLQMMIAIDLIDSSKNDNGEIVYTLHT